MIDLYCRYIKINIFNLKGRIGNMLKINIMLQLEYYQSINDVPTSIWNQFVSTYSVGLEIGHLKAIEVSRINDLKPYYIIGYKNNDPIGIAYCFSMQINFAKMANSYPSDVFDIIKTWKPNFMDMRIIEMGQIASIGSTIEVNRDFISDFLIALNSKIDEIAKIENADLCIIRDIDEALYCDFKVLENYGFSNVMGFPIARMPIKWDDFDGYLKSLKSKKRGNFTQKIYNLQKPEIKVEVIEDYAPYSKRLAELWENVAQKNNGYEHEKLTPEYFEAMSKYLKEKSHVVAIKENDEIVAYGLNLIGDEEYFGVAEGLDYNLRDKYDLYANNIFEALRMACKLKKKIFNIGITAYDFKTSVGAELDSCVYFVKSFRNPCFSAVFADLIKKNIIQPKNNHRVFKNLDISKRIQLDEIVSITNYNIEKLDSFSKHYHYLRADTARATDLYTFCPVFGSAQEPIISHGERNVIMLGTNAYLGLANHPKVIQASLDAINKYGSGCSGSPMMNGTLDLHKQLASEMANFINKQDALIYSTGYQTSVGVISTLVDRNDVLIMDERNHASLIDGAILSRATLVRYRHNSLESLESVLKKYKDRSKLVVTDSLFSMEGTVIDLPSIVNLVKEYNSRLMLDESHAIGVMGPNGRGVAELSGLTNEVDIIIGTFSKSFASIGGFVAGERKIIDTLKHRSRAHIFSASLPPSAVAAVLAAIRIIDEEPERRVKLLENSRYLSEGLKKIGYQVDYYGSAIVPVFCGHELISIAAFQKLFEEGVFVNPVTSPAVPKNHEILRLSLMSTHTKEMLDFALNVFEKIKTNQWPKAK